MAAYPITVQTFNQYEADPALAIVPPGYDSFLILDSAAAIATLSEENLAAAAGLLVSGIESTDGALELDAGQVETIEADILPLSETLQSPSVISVPDGGTITVAGAAADLLALNPATLAQLPALGVTVLTVEGDLRPVFSLGQEAALGNASITVNEPSGVSLTVTGLIAGEGNPAEFVPGTVYTIADTPADIATLLTPAIIVAAPPQITAVASNGPVVLSVAQALALESAALPVSVPAGDSVTVVDTAANLETLSPAQLSALGAIGVTAVAGSDAPPVLSAAQMQALGEDSIPVVAPPNDPGQNDDPVLISSQTGGNLSFEVTFDSSVASAPAAFEPVIEEAFQFYADTLTAHEPIQLFVDIGFGEEDNNSIPSIGSAASTWGFAPVGESYSQLLTQFADNDTTEAQTLALESLPSSDPTGGESLLVPSAEAQVLQEADIVQDAPTGSFTSPDAYSGFGATFPFDYDLDPDSVPVDVPGSPSATVDLLSLAEHELSEDMGRVSEVKGVDTGVSSGSLGQYTPMDLFRFEAPDPDNSVATARALNPNDNPSNFSIDDGLTILGRWNNNTDVPAYDMGDWLQLTPDSYASADAPDSINPITPRDITVMNVIGWDLVTPKPTLQLPSSDILVSFGQLLNDLTVNQIMPGLENAPSGDEYVLSDTALDIESLVGPSADPKAITAGAYDADDDIDPAILMGLGEIISIDGLPDFQPDQIEALQNTPVIALMPALVAIGPSLGQLQLPHESVAIYDTAVSIEVALDSLNGFTNPLPDYVKTIASNDGSLTLSVDNLDVLESFSLKGGTPTLLVGPIQVPTGDEVVLQDSAENIESLSPAELGLLPQLNITVIASTDPVLTFSVAQIEELEKLDTTIGSLVQVTVPAVGFIVLGDKASDIEAMSVQQIEELALVGVKFIEPTDPETDITVLQAEALESVNIPIIAPSVVLADFPSLISGMSASQLSALPGVGVSEIVTIGTLTLNITQAEAIENASLTVKLGGQLQLQDSAGDIEKLSGNTAQLDALTELAYALNGPTQTILAATDGSIVLTLDGALAFDDEFGFEPFRLAAPQGDDVIVDDSVSKLDDLSPQTIDTLGMLGVNVIESATGLTLDTAQIVELERDGIAIETAPYPGLETIEDSAELVAENLTPQVIDALPALSPDIFILSAANPIIFDVAQFQAIEQVGDLFLSLTTQASIADTAADIETLSPGQIGELPDFTITLDVTEGSALDFSIDQALAFYGALIKSGPAAGLEIVNGTSPSPLWASITDGASAFERLLPAQLGELSSSLPLAGISFAGAQADGSLAFFAAQAEAIGDSGLNIGVPTGDTITIVDNGADIKTFLDLGAAAIEPTLSINSFGLFDSGLESQIERLGGITTNDGSIALSVNEAEALEAANAALGTSVAISAPGGTVTLYDSAADIELMSPTELAGLSSIGVTGITVKDQASITLLAAQAAALIDPVPIAVQPGYTVSVSDTQSDIDQSLGGLTPATLAELAGIGVQTIEVSNVTDDGPLTVDDGLTVSIDGPVPASQTITFTGTGGTLALDDTVGMAGTLYGFSPPDTIDLTDVPYDSTGSATLGADPIGNPAIVISYVDNPNIYYLDIDPSQVFLTTPQFNLPEDGGGGGPGTDLTVSEPPVTDESFVVYPGETVDGVVIGSGGNVEVQSGATANDAIVQSGGELVGDSGSTVNNPVIDGGGLLDLATAGAGAGTIGFGPAVGDPIGGTLEIDDTSLLQAVISNFAPGDTIDLTAFPYESDGEGTAVPGTDPNDSLPALVVTENGSTYYLDFDSAQEFAGKSFDLSPDSTGANPGTDITVENAVSCFCGGTAIRTERGDVDVEDLAIGDRVTTVTGEARPIKWIGRRKVAARFANPLKFWPVRIKAGALADNVPARDLLLSPDHAVLLDDILIQAGALVNGSSIIRERRVPESFTYFHIELEDHSLILAENTPAETFVDNVDRMGFDNWAEHEALYPDRFAICEMPYPRAKAYRQVPRAIRDGLEARAAANDADEAVAA